MTDIYIRIALLACAWFLGVTTVVGNGIFDPTQPPYDAPNDDTGDAADGIQRALNDAAAANGVVRLPGGKYRLENGITIPPGVSMEGIGWSTDGALPTATPTNGTWLHVTGGSFTPILIAGVPNGSRGVALRRFGIYHDQPAPQGEGWEPTTYPFAIRIVGPVSDITIENICLFNPSHGIIQDGSNGPTGRININGLYGQPLTMGVQLSLITDVCRIQNVHFWSYWAQHNSTDVYRSQSGTAIRTEVVDNPQFVNIFGYGYNVLFDIGDGVVQEQIRTTTKLRATNVDGDGVNTLVRISSRVGGQASFSNIRGGGGRAPSTAPLFDFQQSGYALEIANLIADELRAQMVKMGGESNTFQASNVICFGWGGQSPVPAVQNDGASNVIKLTNYSFQGAPGNPAVDPFGGTYASNITSLAGDRENVLAGPDSKSGDLYVDDLGANSVTATAINATSINAASIQQDNFSYPAFEGSWQNYGGASQVAAYYKERSGVVRLCGAVKHGAPNESIHDSVIFKLPTGYRPSADESFRVVSVGANDAQINVYTNGDVKVFFGSTTYVSLSGISFRIP